MKMASFKIYVILLGMLPALSACVYEQHRPVRHGRQENYHYNGEHERHHEGNGRFCPPGHAKKGWC